MKFYQLITAGFFLMLVSNFNIVNAQNVTYNIIENNPENVQNLGVALYPISLSYYQADVVNYNAGADAFFRYNDKLMVSSDFCFGLVNNIGGKFGKLSSSYELSPSYDFNAYVHFFPVAFNATVKTRIKLRETGMTTTYTKVPVTRKFLVAMRAGYTINRSALSLQEENPLIKGVSDKDPSTMINIAGTFNYKFQALKLGLGMYIKDYYKIDFESENAGLSGRKKDQGVIYFYVDYLYPLKQSYETMVELKPSVFMGSDEERIEYQLNKDNPMAKHGFIAGMSWFSVTKKQTLVSSKVEIGMLPGPINARENLFISLGIGFGIGKHAN